MTSNSQCHFYNWHSTHHMTPWPVSTNRKIQKKISPICLNICSLFILILSKINGEKMSSLSFHSKMHAKTQPWTERGKAFHFVPYSTELRFTISNFPQLSLLHNGPRVTQRHTRKTTAIVRGTTEINWKETKKRMEKKWSMRLERECREMPFPVCWLHRTDRSTIPCH